MEIFKNQIKKLSEYLASEGTLHIASGLAERMGLRLFIVGGFVRDFLLNKYVKEIDFLVVGSGIDFAERFAGEIKINKVEVYRSFGTAHLKYRNFNYEFVGARKESYNHKSRNPIVETGTFEDDISRRDFTINTLAVSLNKKDYGKLIDIYDGLKDLSAGIIRTPLDPYITFNDDPLRIMRAIRFASQLEFEVDEKVLDSISRLSERLKIISQERITGEFLKILSTPKPSIGLMLLYKTGVLQVIFPEISDLAGIEQRKDQHHKDVLIHTCMVIDNIAKISDNLWLRFSALVHDIAKPHTKKFVDNIGWTFHGHEEIGARMMETIFHRMKLPFNKLDYVSKLIRLHLRPIALVDEIVTDSAIRRLIVAAGDDLEDLITLCRADITSKDIKKVSRYLSNYEKVMNKVREVEEKDRLRAFQSPVGGEVIMEICGIPPSRKVGEIKKAIEDAILDGKIGNNYEEAYLYLLKIKDEFLNSMN